MSSVAPISRSARVSPMQTIATSPARHAASALASTMPSVSPWSVRRSEWPTMTCEAPASFSISAEMSPVCAPLSCQWQSWPPLLTGVRDRISDARDSSVAGTQSSASVSASRPLMKPCPIDISSFSEALVPFIFQLPATSGRMAEIIGRFPSRQTRFKPRSLPKSGHKAIDSGPEGRYCPSITHQARRKNADARNRNETCSTHFARPPEPGSPNFCCSCWSSALRSGASPDA